ncbi:hypothetical protein E4U30_002276 [Claviceps sp. LM220 group G6]|nr:hypothetical protein E4U30_002276 [Claviceps sp. LM220 group G6]
MASCTATALEEVPPPDVSISCQNGVSCYPDMALQIRSENQWTDLDLCPPTPGGAGLHKYRPGTESAVEH